MRLGTCRRGEEEVLERTPLPDTRDTWSLGASRYDGVY